MSFAAPSAAPTLQLHCHFAAHHLSVDCAAQGVALSLSVSGLAAFSRSAALCATLFAPASLSLLSGAACEVRSASLMGDVEMRMVV